MLIPKYNIIVILNFLSWFLKRSVYRLSWIFPDKIEFSRPINTKCKIQWQPLVLPSVNCSRCFPFPPPRLWINWVLKGDSFPNFLLTKDTLRSQWPGMVLNQWLLFCFVPFLALTTTLGLAIALCWLAASHFSVPTSCCFVPQIWKTIIIITFTTTTTNHYQYQYHDCHPHSQ